MDKKEKIILGQAQDTNYDIKLMQKRLIHAKELCYKYNNLSPSETDKRNALLKDLLGKTQNNFLIEQPFICDYGDNIEIGENFYANHNCIILDVAKVIFGDNIFIAPNCSFYTVEHPLDKDERNKGIKYASPIIIGNDVWIGGNTVILPGVTIGDNVVIGAGSIVNKDIPSCVVAAGNPCRIIKEITK